MKRTTHLLVLTLVGLLAATSPGTSHAQWRQSVPIVNIDNHPIRTAGGKGVSMDDVRNAIVRGGASKEWIITPTSPGMLTGTINVRGKHTVVIEISHSTQSYSIRYKSSINMQYENRGGVEVIHPFYNSWIQNLITAIQMQLNAV